MELIENTRTAAGHNTFGIFTFAFTNSILILYSHVFLIIKSRSFVYSHGVMQWTVALEGGPRRVNHAAVAIGDRLWTQNECIVWYLCDLLCAYKKNERK
ncbi:hypothetical protein DICVIV_00157 [Dictyocaulus viviparus]|uniref:Uncharacterized protein n=1 Tax=Dictyocaulus viviparus TaxID=29172 RepID=A0A0D8YA91_DICVI|nr:hypothetical protein DICVIV_00157 [Dictyocaulus viviparus]